jgi:hypothetical protein
VRDRLPAPKALHTVFGERAGIEFEEGSCCWTIRLANNARGGFLFHGLIIALRWILRFGSFLTCAPSSAVPLSPVVWLSASSSTLALQSCGGSVIARPTPNPSDQVLRDWVQLWVPIDIPSPQRLGQSLLSPRTTAGRGGKTTLS